MEVGRAKSHVLVSKCVCVCVCERERERGGGGRRENIQEHTGNNNSISF
jgi:hypothetical protein